MFQLNFKQLSLQLKHRLTSLFCFFFHSLSEGVIFPVQYVLLHVLHVLLYLLSLPEHLILLGCVSFPSFLYYNPLHHPLHRYTRRYRRYFKSLSYSASNGIFFFFLCPSFQQHFSECLKHVLTRHIFQFFSLKTSLQQICVFVQKPSSLFFFGT